MSIGQIPTPNSQYPARKTQRKPRVSFPQRVWIQYSERSSANASVNESYASNISESGIFVQTTDPPKIGSKISLQFALESSEQVIQAVAEVVWIKPFEPINIDGVLPGLGAQFVSMPPENRVHLRNYITKRLPQKTASPDLRNIGSNDMADDKTDELHFPLEKPLTLQVKGDNEMIIGYSQSIGPSGITFVTDYLPKESLVQRFKNSDTLQSLRGCVAVPVALEKVEDHVSNTSSNVSQMKLHLNFLELRNDLLRPVAELTQKTLAKSNVNSSASHQQRHLTMAGSATSKRQKAVLALGALLLIATGFLLGFLAATRL